MLTQQEPTTPNALLVRHAVRVWCNIKAKLMKKMDRATNVE
jgi:hypothetical protein